MPAGWHPPSRAAPLAETSQFVLLPSPIVIDPKIGVFQHWVMDGELFRIGR